MIGTIHFLLITVYARRIEKKKKRTHRNQYYIHERTTSRRQGVYCYYGVLAGGHSHNFASSFLRTEKKNCGRVRTTRYNVSKSYYSDNDSGTKIYNSAVGNNCNPNTGIACITKANCTLFVGITILF